MYLVEASKEIMLELGFIKAYKCGVLYTVPVSPAQFTLFLLKYEQAISKKPAGSFARTAILIAKYRTWDYIWQTVYEDLVIKLQNNALPLVNLCICCAPAKSN